MGKYYNLPEFLSSRLRLVIAPATRSLRLNLLRLRSRVYSIPPKLKHILEQGGVTRSGLSICSYTVKRQLENVSWYEM